MTGLERVQIAAVVGLEKINSGFKNNETSNDIPLESRSCELSSQSRQPSRDNRNNLATVAGFQSVDESYGGERKWES
jgi:hypothetical protein